jgi:sulfatase maturation enzyme AslB (radical SAM superfamily)
MKVLHHWETLNAILGGKIPPPVSCEIDPSNLCNHDCVWCMYHDFKIEKNIMMPAKIMFNLIRELSRGGVKSITFTGGGEPLTNPATVEGLYRVKSAKMEVGLVTNGGLLTPDVSEAIVKTCTFLRVSLDAATRSTHDALHKPINSSKDNFDKILDNIRSLVDLKKKSNKKLLVGIAFLVHPNNYLEIYDASNLAKQVGADYIQIRPVFTAGKKPLGKLWLDIQELMERSLGLIDGGFHVFPILHRFEEVSRIERAYTRCLGHALLGVVGADCNVYLCCQLRGNPRFSFGNLKEKSFFKIWRGKERQEVIKRIDLDRCPPCRYNKYNELLDYLSDRTQPHKNFL